MSQVISFDRHQRAATEFATEASHRIANHLAMVVGMIQTQIAEVRRGPSLIRRDEVGDILRETAGKIVSVAHLHRRLAEQPQNGRIDVGDFLIEIVCELGTSLSLGDKLSVRQRLSAGCSVSTEQARILGLIVGEIVMNAVKHAHPTGIATGISIACANAKDGTLELEVCDDGVGLPEGFNSATDGGVGFGLIRTLARSLDAELRIESDDLGLCFHLAVPAENADESESQSAARPD
jgi:two-component sensor histidine kinase